MKGKAKKSKNESGQRRSPDLEQGKYSDGHPLHDRQYLETKIILKGDRFTSAESCNQFAKVVERAAENAEVNFSRKGFQEERPGFAMCSFWIPPISASPTTSSSRAGDRITWTVLPSAIPKLFSSSVTPTCKAAEMNVRPKISGGHKVEFKAEALPRKDQKRAVQLFIALQYAAQDWLALGMTKTGTVYRLNGNPPSAHE